MEIIEDNQEANRCIRELAALSLLPAIWSQSQPEQIRENLADALQNSLLAEVVYVRNHPDQSNDRVNTSARLTSLSQNEELMKSLGTVVDKALGRGGSDLLKTAIDGVVLNLAVIPLGAGQEFGVLAVGSKRKDFPTATERILLNVAVNQAIIAFRASKQLAARRLGEEALREAAEQHRLALEAGALGSWDYRFDQGTVYWDERCRRMWGLPEGSSLDFDSVIQCLHPDDRQKTTNAVTAALKGVNNGLYQVEFRVVWPDSSVHWVSSKGQVYFKNRTGGEFTRFIGTVREITEEKRANEAVESSERELRALADSIPQLAWMAHPDGRIFWYNRRWFEYTGTTLKEMEGWGWQSVHNPKILPTVVERWNHSISEGIPFEMEFPLRGSDGAFRWFLTRVNPVRDKENRVVRWFGTNTDVDEVRRAREALKEETRLLGILDKTGKSIGAELDLKKVVQSVTDSATELTGAKFGAFFYNMVNEQGEAFLLYTLSGAPREAFENLGHPRATALFGPTFRGEDPIRIDDVRKDPRYGQMAPHYGMPKGHLPVVSYLGVPVISRSGEVIGSLFFGHPEPGIFTERSEKLVVGMAAQAAIAIDNARLFDSAQREITERKRIEGVLREAQEELRRHAENLEREVFNQTAQLRETIQELEAFSYSVSHDMRSPLRAMHGYSEALLQDYKGKIDETGQEYLNRIRRSALRMDLLIQDILAYSRVAKGEIQLKPLNVENVIRDVIQNYPALQPDRAEILVVGPVPEILGHEAYLTQIVSNFLSNAVKFVVPGQKPSVIVRTRAEGEMIRLSFEDNGIGISSEHQKQIFQIFGRVYSDKKYEGTGIGLAIAKKAAERMGGFVGVESEAGKGSIFFVLLKKA